MRKFTIAAVGLSAALVLSACTPPAPKEETNTAAPMAAEGNMSAPDANAMASDANAATPMANDAMSATDNAAAAGTEPASAGSNGGDGTRPH